MENSDSSEDKSFLEENKELQKLKKSTFFLFPLAIVFFLLMIHHSLVKLELLEMWAWEKYLPQI
ncbi:MAG: hypothetical protein LBD88_01400 [Candidatus Peribacteria bacterium]|nr:hypothetical protein [Candidatus Peribacteria bacterium]